MNLTSGAAHKLVDDLRNLSSQLGSVDVLVAPQMLLVTGDREKEMLGRYEENAYFWRMMRVVGHADTELRELAGFDQGNMVEPGFPLLLQFIGKWNSRNSQP